MSKEASAEQDIAVVRAFLAHQGVVDEESAVSQGLDIAATHTATYDVEAAYEMLAPDLSYAEFSGLPYGKQSDGREGFRHVAEVWAKHFDVETAGTRIHGAGDGNVFLTTELVRVKSKKTGKHIDMSEIGWYKVKGGAITSFSSFFSNTTVLEDLWKEAGQV